MNSNDATLFLGVATAIATALGASVSLGLLQLDRARIRARTEAALVLAVSVLGIGASLIAVGKGHTEPVLTWLMFSGLAVPGGVAVYRALCRVLLSARSARLVSAALGATVLCLVAVSSPRAVTSLFRDSDEESRTIALRAADAFENTGPYYRCSNRGHNCPGPAYVAWNIYRNNPKWGDERAFVTVHRATGNTAARRAKNTLTVKPGDEFYVRLYFNNGADVQTFPGAPPAPARNPLGYTKNARAAFFVGEGSRAGFSIVGTLYADNATPNYVSDGAAVVSDRRVRLRLMPGTVRLENNAHYGANGVFLSNSAVIRSDRRPVSLRAAGVTIGFSQLDGRIYGSFNEAGFVTARFAVDAG